MKKLLFLGSVLAASTVASAALANESVPVSTLNGEGENNVTPYSTFQVVQDEEVADQGQVTSVSQLSDVQATDWAYQALQSLVERYGCIAGYPNGTFRGNRAATRYELAAALNACLDQISDRFATKEDLEAVKALQEEFKAELATLKGRVDSLEARSSVLEAQQFSTTTKLVGEAIFQPTIGFGDTPFRGGPPAGVNPPSVGDNLTFNYRATLNFLTSFTGKDLLITSLQQGNYPQNVNNLSIAGPGFTGLLGPQVAQANGDNNNVALFNLQYRFPVFNDKGTVYAVAVGGELSDFVDTLNPNFDSDGQGALSAFGLRNPIYRQINNFQGSQFTGTGLGFNYAFNDKLSLGVGYLAVGRDAADPTGNIAQLEPGAGLFGGDYGAIAQITFKPTKTLGLGLTYVRSYSQAPPNVGFGGITGTIGANNPFGGGNIVLDPTTSIPLRSPTSAHSVGGQFSWEVSPRFALSGWVGATFANSEAAVNSINLVTNTVTNLIPDGADATILNFALAASFPDLFGKGNMGGLIFGAEPSVISGSAGVRTDADFPFHIEALYRFRVNDYISITPGVIAILNPEGNSGNDPVIIGTIRTTFSF
jgi:hypothetical protein